MAAQLLSSKIVIVEEEPRIRSIPALPTAVVGCVGVTERGPIAVPGFCGGFEEYVRKYGGFTPDSDVAIAAFGFYLNDGEQMWVSRTVHYTDINDVNTATGAQGTKDLDTVSGSPTKGQVTAGLVEPYQLADADTLVVNTDGGSPIGTATINAAAAAITSGNSETYTLSDGLTLTVKIDDGSVQTITFNTGEFVDIANATAEEVAAVINGEISGASAAGVTDVTITSDTKGTGSKVEVTGGTANAALGFSLTPVSGTGNVADVDNVTAAEVAGLLDALTGVTGTVSAGKPVLTRDVAGASEWVQIDASSTADGKVGFDNAQHYGTSGAAAATLRIKGKTKGSYANSLEAEIFDASSGVASEFNLSILDDGVLVETYPNLVMYPDTADNHVEAVINDLNTGSDLIEAEDLDLAGDALQTRPANGTYGPLTGGDDGLSGLVDADFIGTDAGDTGLYALDIVQTTTLLIVPGKGTSAIHNAMLQYCEIHRAGSMFAVLDPPQGTSAVGMVTYVETTAALLGASEFGAIYWPWIKILNPAKSVFGQDEQITVAPSGFVVGVYARTDGSQPGGVYQPPAGVERAVVFGCLGFETDEVLDEKKRDIVFPKRINPITALEGTPRHIDGSRTLKGDGNFPFVAERRGVIFIERSLQIGLLFAKHSNNTPALRGRVRRTTTSFLIIQMRVDAFRTKNPATAFFVDVSDKLNPPSVVFAGQLILRIGLATNKPAEFIVLRVSQDTRALEEELAA